MFQHQPMYKESILAKRLLGKSSGKDLEGQSSAVGNDHEIRDEEEREVDDDTDRNMEGNSGHVVETEGEKNEQGCKTEKDVDVDMKDFDFHVDEGVEFMGCKRHEQTVDIEEGDSIDNCVKHIHENMKKRWNGNAYKELLWTAASTTTVLEFQKAMEKLKEFSKEAYEWLNLIPPQHWSRSHFSEQAPVEAWSNRSVPLAKSAMFPPQSCHPNINHKLGDHQKKGKNWQLRGILKDRQEWKASREHRDFLRQTKGQRLIEFDLQVGKQQSKERPPQLVVEYQRRQDQRRKSLT
ncbi:hypothetical protein Tco_1522326 [Tanacetum coccineum]